MIRDLAIAAPDSVKHSDVLVIGAGVAGLLIAAELRRQRMRVTVLESGGEEQPQPTHHLNEVVQLAEEYRGAAHGRFRCLGGTSTRWGGALIPLLDADFGPRPHVGLEAWPIRHGELAAFLPRIEAMFGVDKGAYGEEFASTSGSLGAVPVGHEDMIARFAKWPTFKRRNLAAIFKQAIHADPDLEIWINATVTSFATDRETSRLRHVVARHQSGRTITVEAGQVILCAGAIETTRLLLLLDRQNGGRPFAGCAALGRYFSDHLSMPMATLLPSRAERLNRLAGFRFVGATMRSLRYELSPAAQVADRVGSAFGHISFQALGASGFDALRELLRSWQRTGRVPVDQAALIVKDAPYVVRLSIWRYLRRQLYWPSPARYELHVVGEQLPHAGNRITLSERVDALGVPLAAIDWRRRPSDAAPLLAFRRRFQCFWQQRGMGSVAELRWNDTGDTVDVSGAGDIYHPGCTTRMGDNSATAVVNSDLRLFSIPNVWVASTSVFPSTASANPTLTLMLLALRLAEHLARTLDGNAATLGHTRRVAAASQRP